jgi:hypothetical protein
VSRDADTVGGPIDVVVISKGDGFVWLKRKQYFRADLNPHFIAGYYQDQDGARPTAGGDDAQEA